MNTNASLQKRRRHNGNLFLLVICSMCVITPLRVQAMAARPSAADAPTPAGPSQANAPADAPANAPANDSSRLTRDALTQLLAPIALYPDALIALILPASTVPSDVVLGARYVSAQGGNANVAGQSWDDSVKSLVHYPDVLKWMDQNLDWTTSVGQAFVNQPADVMDAIQQLRAQAKAAGNLNNTSQQKVVTERERIRIVPAQPDVIYVPTYDPYAVYYQPNSFLAFGPGFAVGAWLGFDFDWYNNRFYRGDWYGWNNGGWGGGGGGWNGWNPWGRGGGGTVNVININGTTATAWQPSSSAVNRFSSSQARVRASRVNSLAATASPRGGANAFHGNRRNANFAATQLQPTALNASTSRHGGNRNLQNSTLASTASQAPGMTSNTVSGSTHGHGSHNGTLAPTTAAPNVRGQHGPPRNNFQNSSATTSSRHGHGNRSSTTAAPTNTSPAPVNYEAPASGKQHTHAQHNASTSTHASHHSQQAASGGAQIHHQSHQSSATASHGGNQQVTSHTSNQSHGSNGGQKSDKKKKGDKSNH